MLTIELPRRTISLAPDIPYASLFGARKSPEEKERSRKRNQRKKVLRRSIKTAKRLLDLLPGVILTKERELEKLEGESK